MTIAKEAVRRNRERALNSRVLETPRSLRGSETSTDVEATARTMECIEGQE